MTDHYVSYSQAVKLKELGFSEEVTGKYIDCPNDPTLFQGMLYQPWNLEDDEILAPRLDQAAAWIREIKGWDITSIPTLAEYGEKKYRWDICHWSKPEYGDCSNGIFDTYESALSAGIDKALELLGKEANNGM